MSEIRRQQEAYRNLPVDLDRPLSPEENARMQKIFEEVRLIDFCGEALTDYISMVNNVTDLDERERREVVYELATDILQSRVGGLASDLPENSIAEPKVDAAAPKQDPKPTFNSKRDFEGIIKTRQRSPHDLCNEVLKMEDGILKLSHLAVLADFWTLVDSGYSGDLAREIHGLARKEIERIYEDKNTPDNLKKQAKEELAYFESWSFRHG